MKNTFIFIIIVSLIIYSCEEKNNLQNTGLTLSEKIDKLYKLHDSLPIPKIGDWLAHKKERGQTFKQYVNSNPIYPNSPIDKIYIQPIGKFDKTDSIVIDKSLEFLKAFLGLEIIKLGALSDKKIPKNYKRINNGNEQLQTKYLLDSILIPKMPKDAIVVSAITSIDLYPNEEWNFVFGQAYLKHRVCVSSLSRFKEASSNQKIYLRRFIRTLTHEICHTFSMKHCKIFKCLMNGSNSLQEADKKPIHICPECLKKILWCTNYNINDRYKNLIEFCKENNYFKEVSHLEKSFKIIN